MDTTKIQTELIERWGQEKDGSIILRMRIPDSVNLGDLDYGLYEIFSRIFHIFHPGYVINSHNVMKEGWYLYCVLSGHGVGQIASLNPDQFDKSDDINHFVILSNHFHDVANELIRHYSGLPVA